MGSRQCLKEAFLEHTCAKPPTGRGSCTGSRFQSLILESASSLRTLTGSSSPFFSTKSTKGTGLGLWISKGIVQKYDGRISCRSYRHPGGWTTCFRVFLPAGKASSSIASVGSEAEKLDRIATPSNHRTELQHAE